MRLKPLSFWALAAAIGAGCAASEEPSDTTSGGTKSNAGSGGDSSTAGKGGSSAGTSLGGSRAGGSTGGTETGGTTPNAAGMADGGSDPMPSAGAGGDGSPPEGGMGPGGTGGAGPECTGPEGCNDQNPCTDDACVEGACTHTNNTSPCSDDENDCTDDVCAEGACTHPSNTAACEDDTDTCTNDVCNGGYCTHPPTGLCQCQNAAECDDSNPCTTDACVGNQCTNTANSLSCMDDGNACTDDVCVAGACTHPNNSDSCTDDGNACTGDVCVAGACTHPAIANCCSGDGDCFDNNVCTNDSCVNGSCSHVNNTLGCAADTSPCTQDQCNAGACTHPSNSSCSGADNVIILANRNSKYVVLNGTNLDYTGAAPGSAEVFEKVGENGTKFKLRAKSTGLFVTLGTGDALVATANEAGGMVFDAPTCGAQPWVGLNATTDTNGGGWASADDGNHVVSRSANCGAASGTSWEKFQLISVTRPCAVAGDCNDNNVCTSDACTGGFCVYGDQAGTCADDGNACTSDVCSTGTCTHPGNGTCAGPLVTIQVNRDGKFVVLNGTFLEYTAASAAAAEKFELVDQVGTQFKLRAQTNASFVTLDLTDTLVATTNFAGAMLFDAPACGTKVGLSATTDDDADRWVAADAGNKLIASRGSCPAASATSWEKFTLVPE